MFVHGGLFHVGGNMLYLWIFGDNVEDTLGHLRFTAFYLLAGVAAALTQTVVSPESRIPMVGASGAVSGVLGAYLLLFPYARILTLLVFGFFVRLVYVPADGVVRSHRRVPRGNRPAVSDAAKAQRSPIIKPMGARVRIDRLLADRGLVESREKAARLVLAGEVFVDGERVDKAGALVPREDAVELKGRSDRK